MPRVACLMMLRDEDLLAAPWLWHHGALFGYENLYVYDNGSVAPAVRETLREFAARGVNVDFRRDRPEDFGDKGIIIGNKIREFQRLGLYDIVLPLDCDELVAVTGPAGPSFARDAIMTELARIHAAGAICLIDHHFYNVPGYLDLFWHSWQRKSVIPVAKFTAIDHGFHEPALPPGEAHGNTSLTHIHLHCKPFARVQEGARQKLAPYVNPSDRAALRQYYGVGYHVVGYCLMTADQYYAHFQFPRRPFVRSGFLRRHFAALPDFAVTTAAWEAGRPAAGHDNPLVLDLDATPFGGDAYVAANPGLVGVPIPFLHFLDQGYGDERPMDGTAAGAAELAGRIAIMRRNAGRFAARQRDYAIWAMEWGRNADAVRLWSQYRARYPDDREGYDMAVIACRNAGAAPDEILLAGLARFADYLELARAEAEAAEPKRAAVLRAAMAKYQAAGPAGPPDPG